MFFPSFRWNCLTLIDNMPNGLGFHYARILKAKAGKKAPKRTFFA